MVSLFPRFRIWLACQDVPPSSLELAASESVQLLELCGRRESVAHLLRECEISAAVETQGQIARPRLSPLD